MYSACSTQQNTHDSFFCEASLNVESRFALPELISSSSSMYILVMSELGKSQMKMDADRIFVHLFSAIAIPHEQDLAMTNDYYSGKVDNPVATKSRRKYAKLRRLIELDFLSLSPLHQCRTDPFMQFWDPLAANCYNVSCGHHFENRNGECFYRNITRLLSCNKSKQDIIQLKWWEVR